MLMSQEDLDELCPGFVEELDECIKTSPNMADNEEGVIYALAQLLHNRINAMKIEDEEKGMVVATLINGLVSFNQIPLALHRQQVAMIIEGKAGTLH